MKASKRSVRRIKQWARRAAMVQGVLAAALLFRVADARAEDEEEEAEEGPTPEEMFEGGANSYVNWVDFSFGGLIASGSRSQAEERQRLTRGPFGGISDLHYQQTVATNTTFSIDGRALFDLDDYKLTLGLKREEVGYLRFNYQQFRTWYNGDGGFYPPRDQWYPLSEDALGLDRGEVSFEAGLRLENKPAITFKYTHQFRDGEKGSTTWGAVHPDPVNNAGFIRGLGPAFYEIDEARDIFSLDATHRIKATTVGLGLRFESSDLDNARKVSEFQREPAQRKLTHREGTSYNLFSVHTFTETWIRKDLFFSSGFLFANLDSDFSGSRIYGSDFDVRFTPGFPLGYTNLLGHADKQEYVLNLNLMAIPVKHLTIVPSIRVQKEDWSADSRGFGTQGTSIGGFSSESERDALDVRERLDLRYTGVTNWVFHAGGEWTQGDGDLEERGGLSRVGSTGVAPISRETDDQRFFQKYNAGVRWIPVKRVSIDLDGYYKNNDYEYDHRLDSTANAGGSGNRYPAYLRLQNFETYDGSLRLSLRPHSKVTLVSRYEYQLSTINTQPASGSGLAEVESSEMDSHIFAQNVSWTPWSRLNLQVGFNYVVSETRTPATSVTRSILEAQNNYWTVNFASGFVVDDRTDFNLGYFFYKADNYDDNSLIGVPYGAEAEEHGITATIVRRLTENLRLTLRYGFFHYRDVTSGGNNNYTAHLLFSGLRYRF